MTLSSFPPLHLKGRELLPIVQGGMGVGVSAHRLTGAVARLGGVGTIASVDLRRLHPDLMARSARTPDLTGVALKDAINAANLEALDREVRAAKELAQGRGMVAVNVMRAVTEYVAYVKQACQSGVDAIVMGAGLPLDLPEMAADYPDVALIPILSDVRGISLLVKKWQRKGRLPDAIIIEHPRYAGGHLGAPRPEDIADPRFDFETVLPGAIAALEGMGIEPARVPLIPAGGINSFEKVQKLLALGAAAVQLGTPFAVTEEGDAHPNFKRVLAAAQPEDIVTFMSVAGLPARAVRTPWLTNYLNRAEKLCAAAVGKAHKCTLAWDCLLSCGLRDSLPKAGQFCIDNQLAAALHGDVEKGLFFRGAESLPFGQAIRPVRELMDYLLSGKMPRIA
ncbi:MAG: 2-nitropropane dioxygenase [Rhodocyclales bacterium GWA2_65_20]|nr:MAG: 2-nitropropane dioxygenase [Rhodocyclales bacterium GWA2_65_20]